MRLKDRASCDLRAGASADLVTNSIELRNLSNKSIKINAVTLTVCLVYVLVFGVSCRSIVRSEGNTQHTSTHSIHMANGECPLHA